MDEYFQHGDLGIKVELKKPTHNPISQYLLQGLQIMHETGFTYLRWIYIFVPTIHLKNDYLAFIVSTNVIVVQEYSRCPDAAILAG